MTSPSILVLENGRVFRGLSVGPVRESLGEVVFNTSLSGYQEILSDPSYAGQIVVMTAPQIGNTGVNQEDMEADTLPCAGLVMRHSSPVASSWRSESSLPEFLETHTIPAIEGIDTRALTRVLRTKGSMRGAISADVNDVEGVLARVRAAPSMEGRDLASGVSCKEEYLWDEPRWIPEEMKAQFPLAPIEFEIVAY
ncbi:MAG: carbamoyl phosphate synthase small subunit, partial [Kofleriaceae bacterium]|nr:carbamoyl phosphate synthase small subunit [Kofleriaceae bacterium]